MLGRNRCGSLEIYDETGSVVGLALPQGRSRNYGVRYLIRGSIFPGHFVCVEECSHRIIKS